MPLYPDPLNPKQKSPAEPRTVVEAKVVELALVTYVDEYNQPVTQLVLVGANNVNLLESRSLGIGRQTTPQGLANPWLRDGIMKKLGRPVPGETPVVATIEVPKK
jgi:hypothetical protein